MPDRYDEFWAHCRRLLVRIWWRRPWRFRPRQFRNRGNLLYTTGLTRPRVR